jgi:transposase
MRAIHEVCCGLDVHKRQVVACLLIRRATGELRKEVRTFQTIMRGLLELADWLAQGQCTHVAMESTGVYWKPVYNVLASQCEVLVVNAQHLKAVPGRKTDVRDAEWIAELLQHGLLRGSYIPSAEQRELRELTRHRRTLVEERVRVYNRLQKVLEDANIKLGDVVSSIDTITARRILQALTEGQTDPAKLADLACGTLRKKREALQAALVGNLKPHHAFMLADYLSHVDYLDESIARVNVEIEHRLQADERLLALLDIIPGVSVRIAQVILAEIGRDMARFPSAKHLASWAGLCPGNHESAGKQSTGRIRHGNPSLRQALVEAAHAAARNRQCYFYAQYRRLAARRGKARALIAVAHSLLTVVYHILKKREPYRELGNNYFDERDRQAVSRRLLHRLEKLGYQVTVASQSAPA